MVSYIKGGIQAKGIWKMDPEAVRSSARWAKPITTKGDS